MRTLIERIQHPVGQGGFYAEHHQWPSDRSDRVVVYDCGSLSPGRKALEREIAAFHKKNEKTKRLDALVLSHFHADHLNGINGLLKEITNGTRRIFLPYLTDEEAKLVALDSVLVAYEEEGETAVPTALATVFPWTTGPSTSDNLNIVRVKGDQEGKEDEPGEIRYLGILQDSIHHKDRISLWEEPGHWWNHWILKFFCKKAPSEKIKELMTSLKELKLKEEMLKEGGAALLTKWLNTKGMVEKIKKAYAEAIPGADKSHNIVSMVSLWTSRAMKREGWVESVGVWEGFFTESFWSHSAVVQPSGCDLRSPSDRSETPSSSHVLVALSSLKQPSCLGSYTISSSPLDRFT